MEQICNQRLAVLPVDLIKALGPTHPLGPRLAEGFRLLVIQHRLGAEGDLPAPGHLVHGELDILRQQEEVPAAARFQHTVGKQKACAGHGAAGAQQKPGVVEIPALPQEPQGITGADPVVAVVLAVAEAGDDVMAVGKRPVHGLHIVGSQNIVRVKHEVSVEALGIVLLQVLQQLLQSVALAHLHLVEPLIHVGPGHPGHHGRVVGAVVRQDENGQQTLRIRLSPEAGDQVADDPLLVPGADQNGVPVGLGRAVGLLLPQPGHRDIQKLIGIADEENNRYDKIYSKGEKAG